MGRLAEEERIRRILLARQTAENIVRVADHDFAMRRIDYETYQRKLAEARQVLRANNAE